MTGWEFQWPSAIRVCPGREGRELLGVWGTLGGGIWYGTVTGAGGGAGGEGTGVKIRGQGNGWGASGACG